MSDITLGLNFQIYGIDTYDVFVSPCPSSEGSWVQVADDIGYSSFPFTFDIHTYISTPGDCYEYYISGNTGCECSGSGTTLNQTPTPTPTNNTTPTITPTNTPTPSITPTLTNTPTPTITPSQWVCRPVNLNWTFDSSIACSGSYTNTNTYYTDLPLAEGNMLYQDSHCSVPVPAGRFIVLGSGVVFEVTGLQGELVYYSC